MAPILVILIGGLVIAASMATALAGGIARAVAEKGRAGEMAEFHAIEWYLIPSHGWVAMVIARDEPNPLGKMITIDGETLKCIGVEQFVGDMDKGYLPAGKGVGLLVEGVLDVVFDHDQSGNGRHIVTREGQ